MNKIVLLFIASLMLISCVQSRNTDVKEVDVCVYGGTSAGVVAAYSAKMMGKSVLLIEPGKYLGGMTTGGLGSTDIGNKYAVTGLARLFYRRVGEHYGQFEQWMFPPSVATKAMMRFIDEAQVEVLYQHRIVSAEKDGAKIVGIHVEHAADKETASITVKAKQFIDCSYEGDLMAKSGVSYATGREDCKLYGETLNGVQMSYWHQFPDGVDPYVVKGDSTSGYCWGINANKLVKTGTGDDLIQAYNFRLCLTNNPKNRRPFEKPINYQRDHYELLARAIEKMDPDINKFLLINWGQMPEDKYDVNNRGPLSTDMIGMNYGYPDGDYETRTRIWQEHVDYTKGLLYFLSHDEAVPSKLRNAVAEFGWAKDEFVDNDNFPTQLYIREARRMIGEYIMTQKNCQGQEIVEDGIGLAAYIMDSHNCQRIVVDGMVKNEGDVESGGFSPYPISYRSITPKRSECTNLLVPVCVSASHIAYGSIRMEPVFMVLGQSAAVASVMALNKQVDVQDVDVSEVKNLLKSYPYLDGSIPEILLDDSDMASIEKVGDWNRVEGYYYKNSYTHAESKSGKITIKGQVQHAGKYEVQFYCSSSIPLEKMPKKMNLTAYNGFLSQQLEAAPKENVGRWNRLGVLNLEKGEISFSVDAHTADGVAFIDAIILNPKK